MGVFRTTSGILKQQTCFKSNEIKQVSIFIEPQGLEVGVDNQFGKVDASGNVEYYIDQISGYVSGTPISTARMLALNESGPVKGFSGQGFYYYQEYLFNNPDLLTTPIEPFYIANYLKIGGAPRGLLIGNNLQVPRYAYQHYLRNTYWDIISSSGTQRVFKNGVLPVDTNDTYVSLFQYAGSDNYQASKLYINNVDVGIPFVSTMDWSVLPFIHHVPFNCYTGVDTGHLAGRFLFRKGFADAAKRTEIYTRFNDPTIIEFI